MKIAATIGKIIILRLKSDLDLAAEGGRSGLATTTKVRNRHNSKSYDGSGTVEVRNRQNSTSCAQNAPQSRRISNSAPHNAIFIELEQKCAFGGCLRGPQESIESRSVVGGEANLVT